MKPNARAFFFALATLPIALAGCGGGDGGPEQATPVATSPLATSPATIEPTATPLAMPTEKSSARIALVPFSDPWQKARPRWRDIANNEYAEAFRSGPTAFSYRGADVSLSYDHSPTTPYFSGRIEANGLKPNFAYQIKLAGKPIYGSRGFGATGSMVNVTSRGTDARPFLGQRRDSNNQPVPINADDWTNQQLGYAGRWWDDTQPPGTNLDDAYYRTYYPRHTVYGYIFLGDFVTDATGHASANIAASKSYHITWQDQQNGIKDVLFGNFAVRSSPSLLGYQRVIPSTNARLWYEYESSRAHDVRLRAGTYHCRLLVTEEAFHTSGGENGGLWQTVLATEEVRDSNAANDIVFTIR